jgi:hypothetical protein
MLALELQFAFLGAPQVEQIVDELQQVAGVALDRAHRLLLLVGRQFTGDRLVAEAEDRRQRRAQLVADVGEELRLRVARGLRFELALPREFVLAHPMADVLQEADQQLSLPGHHDRMLHRVRVDRAARRRHLFLRDVDDVAGRHHRAVGAAEVASFGRCEQIEVRLAQDGGARRLEEALHLRIPQHEAVVILRVLDEHAEVEAIDDGTQDLQFGRRRFRRRVHSRRVFGCSWRQP